MKPTAFDIFCRVVDLDPAARSATLMEACGSDRDLFAEVDSLLRAHDTADGQFLETSALHGATQEALNHVSPDSPDLAGMTLRPYRLRREIGSGGMGSVWLADRVDGEFEQQVAVKLIRRGMDTEDILRRFRTERQVLASLQHPHIARLLDGGTTTDGLPYLVMEYVEGERIDRWCDQQRLNITQRINLFLDVCDAVHDAHRNLVVHRDLKPGNILVAADGAPKLLDFGIAKMLDTADHAPDATLNRDRRLTLAYASPEQIRGGIVTTATDVYSLGVILFELLTGSPPYDLSSKSVREAEQVICETAPSRPRTAVTTSIAADNDATRDRSIGEERALHRSTDLATLQRRLAGDLERIVLKALHKDPARRYASVDQLSADLRRYLQGMPVSAQPDTLNYRMHRFVSRHRAGVAISAIVAIVLIGATVVSSTMFVQARRSNARAEDEAAAATAVSAFLREMIGSVDPVVAQGRDVTLFREMLETTAARLERDPVGPVPVHAELHSIVGKAFHSIGEYERAIHHLGRSVMLRRNFDGDPVELADTLMAWGAALHQRARYNDALAALTEARTLLEESLPAGDRRIAGVIAALGTTHWGAGRYNEGEQLLRQSVLMMREASDVEPARLANALRELAGLLTDRHEHVEALPMLQEAQRLLVNMHGEHHPSIARIESDLGWCARRDGRHGDAVNHYRRALEIQEAFLEPDHPSIGYTLTGLAAALEDLHQFDEAEALYLRALEIGLAARGPEHTEIGTIHNNLGGLYHKLNRFDEAAHHLRRAVEIYTTARGADDYWTSIPLLHLARVYVDSGEAALAEDAVEACLRIRREHAPPNEQEMHAALLVRGRVLVALDRFEEAAPILRESLAVLMSQVRHDHPLLVEARAALETAEERLTTAPSPNHPICEPRSDR